MRRVTLLVLLGLAVIVAATSGCSSPPPPVPPSARVVGVVEIYRVDPVKTGPAGHVSVGFASVDPLDTSVIWWLLAAEEEPPVMPAAVDGVVQWVKRRPESMTGAQLCTTYGSMFGGTGRIWRVDRDSGPPTDCK